MHPRSSYGGMSNLQLRSFLTSLLQSFEELVGVHMFASVAAPSPNVAPEFVRYRCLVEREAVKQAVNTMGQTNIKKWLNKAS